MSGLSSIHDVARAAAERLSRDFIDGNIEAFARGPLVAAMQPARTGPIVVKVTAGPGSTVDDLVGEALVLLHAAWARREEPAQMLAGPNRAEALAHLETLRVAATPGRLRKGTHDKKRVFIPYPEALEGPLGERCLLLFNEHFPFDADAAYLEAAWNMAPALARAALVEGEIAAAWRRYAQAIVACERAHEDHDVDAHSRAAIERHKALEELRRLDPVEAAKVAPREEP